MSTADLHDVFLIYAQGELMDNRTFNKLLKDAKILDGKVIKTHDVDLIFAQAKPKGQRKIDFTKFAEALNCVCIKREETGVAPDPEGLVARIVAMGQSGPDYSNVSSKPPTRGVGPERFHDDKTTFTGAHARGGPTVASNGYHDLSKLTNRQHTQDDSVQRRKKSLIGHDILRASFSNAPVSPKGAAGEPTPQASPANSNSGRRDLRGPEKFFYDKSTFTGAHRNGGPTTFSPQSRVPNLGAGAGTRKAGDPPRPSGAPGGLVRPKNVKATNPVRGPERFFYDQKSYTGAHKAGGPSTDDRGNGGYVGNFDKLISRDHTQNDALQRRKQMSPGGS